LTLGNTVRYGTWSLAVGLQILVLTGCATTGRVADNTFRDARHGIRITFPSDYSVKPASDRNSRYRVKAVRRVPPSDKRSEAIVPSYGLYVAPKSALQRRANTNDELFEDFVSLESDNYCARLYRIVARPHGDRTVKLPTGVTALIRHFNSSVLLPGDTTAYGNGMAAFLDGGDCFVKLEYVADSASFDTAEFLGILKSINIK
jgi:hypothetical protein